MELRAFAERILRSSDLDEKLAPVPGVTDESPGDEWRAALPARPPQLLFCGRRQAPAMPAPASLVDPRKRAIAHHVMANHELQALEVMAFVVCAFPAAPSEFRAGLFKIMLEEQRHTRWHLTRLDELGLPFGSLPVNGYFWKQAQEFDSLLTYLATLPLTFEGCNLDHTLDFKEWFAAAGDQQSAGIMQAIHRDEIRHVAFGIEWLNRLKPADQSEWDAYAAHLKWPLRPAKARGTRFRAEPRLAAGLTPEFIAALEQLGPETE